MVGRGGRGDKRRVYGGNQRRDIQQHVFPIVFVLFD